MTDPEAPEGAEPDDENIVAATPEELASRGRTTPRSIEKEMKESYLTYALSVIHSRALPDVRDGLKPSQRRILVAMNDLNLSPRAKYRKCAKVAGDTSGNYHPHGESVIYPTLVRMAQDFSLRYPLVDGQGNFGSIDGDPPAAMRYTEAKMAGITMEILSDLDKETVDLEPNYDETRMQPTVLPSRFPNLLCNGSDGIAVGMATSLPPHNLREIGRGLVALLEDPDLETDELLKLVPGPDFPTGGTIMGRSGIVQAYTTGRGLVRVRAKYEIEENKTRAQIVFSEIPYQTKKGGNDTGIIAKIVQVVKDGRIVGISDVTDYSNRDGMRLVVKLKRGEDPQVVLNQLWKYTPLQSTYSIINLAIDRRQPRTLPLRDLMSAWLVHRRDVLRRRTMYLLRKAEERMHIVDGLRIAVDNIDRVIAIIRASANRDDAKAALSAEFGLSPRQSQAIVDMRLGSLTGLEREKLEEEHAKLLAEIADYRDILDRADRVTAMIRADILEIVEKYGDERRTVISLEEVDGSVDIADLITEDLTVVTLSRENYIKRVPLDTFRAQARGGRGIKGSDLKDSDVQRSVLVTSTHDYLLFFSNMGQVFWQKGYQIPEAGRNAKGRSITNVLQLREGEEINTILRVPEFDDERFIVFATKSGIVKKTKLEAYSRPKKGGIRAILVDEDDEVVSVRLAKPGDTVLLSMSGGRAIRFDEAGVRSMGRTSRGVKGVRLKGGDTVVGMVVAEPDAFLLTATENGFGKRTPLIDYPIKGRGGQGVIDIKSTERNGSVIQAKFCRADDDLMFITTSGMIVRTHVADVSSIGRNTQGVRLVNLKGNDKLVSVEVVSGSDLERFANDGAEAGAVPTEGGAEGATPEDAVESDAGEAVDDASSDDVSGQADPEGGAADDAEGEEE
ncbi:MAG: DNA gyrase subunit A [Planctomycetota bacterium]|jgi:DNA gyrase subunit A